MNAKIDARSAFRKKVREKPGQPAYDGGFKVTFEIKVTQTPISTFGKWMALTAGLLGWLFDGFEMGLFPLVARPALMDLLTAEYGVERASEQFSTWLGIITALFLVGAATGGVLFGWLGDRFGRVRAMMLSVLTYALVSGLCGFATSAWQIGALRFVASLGMGGEWSLGVALINELWPDRSRAFLAGLIGAAANVGYLLSAVIGVGLSRYVEEIRGGLLNMGVGEDFVAHLLANGGWRLIMMIGALPALLTFFIRLYVPESARWEHERDKGSTSHWAAIDLLGVLIGGFGAIAIVVAWVPALALPMAARVAMSVAGFLIAFKGYTYPVQRFLARSETPETPEIHRAGPTYRRMIFGACLSGIALLGTWGSVQQAPPYTSALISAAVTANSPTTDGTPRGLQMTPQEGSSYAQAASAFGAIIGTILAALLADRAGRRMTYFFLCLGSLVIVPGFYLTREVVDESYFFLVFLLGAITASFYGWLPLYLPEIFRTSVRATGQGFGFNFGRILAAIGVLQLGNLTALFEGGLPVACASFSAVYVLGMILIWFVPETKGQPLPE
jgi:SHS family sialic acid transporter-like MFS transporter